MTTSVVAYVNAIDRALGAGQHLFTASSGPARLDERTVPSPPGRSGSGGLSTGSLTAGERYGSRWSAMSVLDGRASAAAADGSAEAHRGRAGARRVRETARGQAAAIAPGDGLAGRGEADGVGDG